MSSGYHRSNPALNAVAATARVPARRPLRACASMLALSAIALGATACNLASPQGQAQAGPYAPLTRVPASKTFVLTGPPGAVAAHVAQQLFASAPVVVVANVASKAAVTAAAADAGRVHAPLFLSSGHSGARSLSSLARTEIKALRPKAVLAVGLGANELSGPLGRIQVVTSLGKLPKTTAPLPVSKVILLTRDGENGARTSAAVATAHAAGAQVITVHGYDPQADPAAITAIAAVKPAHVLALGSRFGPAKRLSARIAVAATGVQLPGGGQVLFPMHRLVALYGHPGAPALGALGEQDLPQSIARIKRLAALYRPLSKVPVIPTFEIIASVAQGADEPEGGTYSYLTPIADIRPWVQAASKAGMYVVLDLQPGRANFLTQAKWYKRLLELPNVGLALDPEWKLGPTQMPLQQIGSVNITEVNSVIKWLAGLTARYHLPQKLLVLHQFRLNMIIDEQALDTHHDDLAIVIHMDGQGTPADKQQTWDAVTGAAPRGVYFGWKNFFVKDHPMLTPSETMQHTPQPVMISYQ